MEEKLQKIIELHEAALGKYTQERDTRNAKMQFLKDHKFEKEYEHLLTQKMATGGMFCDYRHAIDELRKMLDAWSS